jgi:predicted transcriptional regulator
MVHDLTLDQTLVVINLPKGESSREQVCWQIQKFLLNNSATFTQIVESCDAAKAAISKYLTELVDEEKIIWKPKRKHGKNKYALSKKAKNEVILLLEKQKIKTQIDQMSSQNFQEFKKLLDFLAKSKEGEELLLKIPDAEQPEKIKKFKNINTKILIKD